MTEPLHVHFEDLGVGDHTICVRATGSDAGGTGSVTDCKTIHLLKLTLEPATADNELGSDNEHTVTATLLGDAAYVAANPASIAQPRRGFVPNLGSA